MTFDIGKPDDPRHAILERYERGELTREQADAEAIAGGFESMEVRPDADKFDPLAELYWTIPMALTWIIYRRADRVRYLMEDYRLGCKLWRHIEKYRVVNGMETKMFELRTPEEADVFDVISGAHLETDEDSLIVTGHDARQKLWQTMKFAALVADGIPYGRTLRERIPEDEWEFFSWNPKGSIAADDFGADGEQQPRYRKVRVRTTDVIVFWPALNRIPASRRALPKEPENGTNNSHWLPRYSGPTH